MAETPDRVTVKVVPTIVPTQVAYPWKATLRTFLAVLVSAGVVVPAILAIIQQTLGVYISPEVMAALVWTSGLIVAISTAITKIMAIPRINAWLTRFGIGAVPSSVATATAAGIPVVGTITTTAAAKNGIDTEKTHIAFHPTKDPEV